MRPTMPLFAAFLGLLLAPSLSAATDNQATDQESQAILLKIEQQLSRGHFIAPSDDNAVSTWQEFLRRAALGTPGTTRALAEFAERMRDQASDQVLKKNLDIAADLQAFEDLADRLLVQIQTNAVAHQQARDVASSATAVPTVNIYPKTAPSPNENVSLKTAPSPSDNVSLKAAPPPNETVSLKTAPSLNETVSLKTVPPPNETVSLKTAPSPNDNVSLKAAPPPNETISLKTAPSLNETVSLKTAPSPNDNVSLKAAPPPDETVSLKTAPSPNENAAAAALLSRGDALLAIKDISGARKFYEYAANLGSAAAAMAMARTFDPDYLNGLGVAGLKPDPERAVSWYRKASALGDHNARLRLQTIGASQ